MTEITSSSKTWQHYLVILYDIVLFLTIDNIRIKTTIVLKGNRLNLFILIKNNNSNKKCYAKCKAVEFVHIKILKEGLKLCCISNKYSLLRDRNVVPLC